MSASLPDSPVLSVVIPALDERDVLPRSLDRLRAVLETCDVPFEILCIDDGSTDGTGELLHDYAEGDSRIVPLFLSRTFGKEAAILAGMSAARGQATVVMDADLQHPPELIPEMLAAWREGVQVVSATKVTRGRERRLYRAFAGFYNRLFAGAVRQDLAGDSDFKLLDREAVDAVLSCSERNRYFRGLVAWVGFRTKRIPFHVADRPGGTSKWTVLGLVRYSIRNLVAFSSAPLRAIGVLGLVTAFLGLLLGLQTLYNYASGQAVSGFTTVILTIVIFGGINLIALGIMAVYLSVMYEEAKRRPPYVIVRSGRRRDGDDEQDQSRSKTASTGA